MIMRPDRIVSGRVVVATCAGEQESVAVIAAENDPGAVGVPLMSPPELIVRPFGSPVAPHVTLPVPSALIS